jgi:hypothetical protein
VRLRSGNSRFLGCRRVLSGCVRNDRQGGSRPLKKGTPLAQQVSDVEDARVADRSELRWHLQWEAGVRVRHKSMSHR